MDVHQEFVGEVVRVVPWGFEVAPVGTGGDEPGGFLDRAKHPAWAADADPPSAGDLLGAVVLDADRRPLRLSALAEDVALARGLRTGEPVWGGQERTFAFRYQRAGRGSACEVTARLEAGRPAEAVVVDGGVGLAPPPGVYWNDLAWLAFGLSLHGPYLASVCPAGCVVRVTSLDCVLVDHLPEVVALAIDGWVRRELGAPDVGASVRFDDASAQFVFDWGGAVPFAAPVPRRGPAAARHP